MGLTEDSRGASQARDRRREVNGQEVQAAWGEVAFCHLANISRTALEGARRRRLLHRANGDIQSFVRLPRTGT